MLPLPAILGTWGPIQAMQSLLQQEYQDPTQRAPQPLCKGGQLSVVLLGTCPRAILHGSASRFCHCEMGDLCKSFYLSVPQFSLCGMRLSSTPPLGDAAGMKRANTHGTVNSECVVQSPTNHPDPPHSVAIRGTVTGERLALAGHLRARPLLTPCLSFPPL